MGTNTMIIMDQFIRQHGIVTVRVERTNAEHNRLARGDWRLTANPWRVYVGREGHPVTMGVNFWTGTGIKERPTAADVLNAMALDSSMFEQARSFEEWADELGFERDDWIDHPEQARQARKTYRDVREQAERLKNFLGADAYDQLLYHVEPL